MRLVAGKRFTSPEEVISQLRAWSRELDKDSYVQRFHEARGQINSVVDEYNNARDRVLINMYTLGKETTKNDFSRVKKAHRPLWLKADIAVKIAAKNQKASEMATQKVLKRWQADGERLLETNQAQGRRKAAGRLAVARFQ
ncbi:hypothetical protein BDW59DRAFT_163309 [Aspergillus cavernicola]|uniref:Uncharacterized protein n=1 Tax=Aspergillus cavernicola TaxID=176166 RepID=A0ABR4I6G2_9EURO